MSSIALTIGGGSPASILEPTLLSTQPRTGLATVTGTYRAQTASAIISGKQFTGDVYHEANGVEFEDCEFQGAFGVCSAPGGNPSTTRKESVKYTNCIFYGSIGCYGGFKDCIFNNCAVVGNGMTNMQLNDGGGANTAANLVLNQCYLNNVPPTFSSGAHWELLHGSGIAGVSLTYNSFYIYSTDPSIRDLISYNVNLDDFSGSMCSGVDISNNWIRGGSFWQLGPKFSTGTINSNKFFNSAAGNGTIYPSAGTSWTASGNTKDGTPFSISAGGSGP